MRGFIRFLIPVLFIAILGRSIGLSFAFPTIPLPSSSHGNLVQGNTSPSAPLHDPTLADYQKVRKHRRRVRRQLSKAFVTLPVMSLFTSSLNLARTSSPSQEPPTLISIDSLSRPPCC